MRRSSIAQLCLALLAACVVPLPARATQPAPGEPEIRELELLSPAAARLVADSGKPIGVAVLDLQTNVLWSVNGPQLFYAYSIVKVAVMLGVLDRAQREGRPLSRREDALIGEMIRFSDNLATSKLLAAIGGGGALQHYLRSLGLTKTSVRDDLWGGSTTTPQEQARMLALLADCRILEPKLCDYALAVMRSVTPGQAWGATGGAPAGAAIALKNGWFPEAEGWGINTVAYIVASRRYTMAILSRQNPTKASGIEVVERIAGELHAALQAPLEPQPSPAAVAGRPAVAYLFHRIGAD